MPERSKSAAAAGATSPGNAHEFSVSELSFALKRTVEDTFGHVRVRGEITGYRGPHSSGHAYFALKDEGARLEAVIWKGVFGRLRFKPEEGLEVIATGKLTTYPGSSKYQVVIEQLEPAGVGALMALLEERKKKLQAEGLFEAGRKQPLPFLPAVIGVVTSPTGAVIRDILHRLQDRFPRHVLVWPVRVQGETSAAEVAAAINGFNALPVGGKVPRPELLIVARGGGSIEDLWSFNEEIVVRAAAESAIPLISAVGHETDTTLIDYASDRRAPTPTAAAEIAVPVRSELLLTVGDAGQRLMRSLTRRLENARTDLRGLTRGLPRLQDIIALPRQRLDQAADLLPRGLRQTTQTRRQQYEALAQRFAHALSGATQVKRNAIVKVAGRLSEQPIKRQIREERLALAPLLTRGLRAEQRHLETLGRRVETAGKMLDAYDYRKVLARGYAVVRDEQGEPVTGTKGLKPGDALNIEFAREERVEALVKGEAGKTAVKKAEKPAPSRAKPVQGSLL
ncbi:MAG: exodeoxyribonuclease VII large subunit [Rhizobiales bacterium]|nr:exodeoxyribonuclease VII large subunit [Hyphomicrobiales bacterium]